MNGSLIITTTSHKDAKKQFYNMGLYQFDEDYKDAFVGINDFIVL